MAHYQLSALSPPHLAFYSPVLKCNLPVLMLKDELRPVFIAKIPHFEDTCQRKILSHIIQLWLYLLSSNIFYDDSFGSY